ncbi:MAG: diguanylate cyclase [Pseudomonadota bacterium]
MVDQEYTAQASAETFEGLVRELPMPILVAQPKGRTLFANDAARRLFDLSRESELPSLAALLFDDDLSVLAGLWEALDRTQHSEVRRCQQISRAAQSVVELRARRLHWDGEPALQVTLILLSEQGGASHETIYRQMFSTNPAVKLLVDPYNGRIMDANPSAAAFYGYPLEVLKRLHIGDINCLSPAELEQRMEQARACRQLFFEFQHRTASGEVRDVHVYTGPVTVGEREYLHSIIVDVTDEKRYCAQLAVHDELIRNLPVGVYRNTPGPDGRFITANPAMLAIFEAGSLEALCAVPVSELYDSPAERRAFSEAILREGAVERQRLRLRSLKGRRFWAEVTARKQIEVDGRVVFNGIIEDVTARNEARVLKERLTHLLDASPDFVSITDAEQRVVYLNRAARRLVGELPDRLPEALSAAHPEWARRLIADQGIPFAQQHGHWYAETALQLPSGELPVSQLIVSRRDAQGKLDCIATIMRDISQTKRYEAELEYLAGHDPLTGAVNRNRFVSLLERERVSARRQGRSVSLVMFDIDHFKRVNDSHGHGVGDEVLRKLVRISRSLLREMDVLARWGGEEFMLLLSDTAPEGALTLAERLRQAIAAEDFAPVSGVTSSFGVAELLPEELAEDCFKRLDVALYAAKAAGRNRVVVAEPAASADAMRSSLDSRVTGVWREGAGAPGEMP